MESESIAAMLRRDHAEWEALVSVLEANPEGPLHAAGAPEWASRDVYAHLARWIDYSVAQLEARLTGRQLPELEGSDDEINARWQRDDSALTLVQARERAQQAFERRLRVIEAVPADAWDPVLEAMARADGAEHYANHRKYIVAR